MKVSKDAYDVLITNKETLKVHLSGLYILIEDMSKDIDEVFSGEGDVTEKDVKRLVGRQIHREELIGMIMSMKKVHNEMFGDFDNMVVDSLDFLDKREADAEKFNRLSDNNTPPLNVKLTILLSNMNKAKAEFVKMSNGDLGFMIEGLDMSDSKNKSLNVIGWLIA